MLVFFYKEMTSIQKIFPKKKFIMFKKYFTPWWIYFAMSNSYRHPFCETTGTRLRVLLEVSSVFPCVSLPPEQDCLAKTRLHQIDPQAHGFGTCRSLDLRDEKQEWGDGRGKVDGLCFKVRNESDETPQYLWLSLCKSVLFQTSVFNVDVAGENYQYDRGALETCLLCGHWSCFLVLEDDDTQVHA